MKIGFLWHCVYPWDVRLEKIMKACADEGHEVVLISRGKRGLAREDRIGRFRVRRVLVSNLLPSFLEKLMVYPLFLNPVWIYQTWRILRNEKVDVIVVRDLPLSLLAGCLGKLLHKPVIMDMAENYPAALIAYRKAVYKPFLVARGWLPKTFEKISLKTIGHVFVVTAEQAERLQQIGVDSSQITLVGNTPETGFFAGNGHGQIHQRVGTELLFVGKLDAHRGTELLVRAMSQLIAEFPGLRLTLVGDGSQREKLMEVARSLQVADRVEFPGWIDFAHIPEYIHRSSICLIPHLRSQHTDTTLPNKLFDYMAFAKPVLAADCKPIQRIIDETGCGMTFRSGDMHDLTTVLRRILCSPDREKMGKNGRTAVEAKYNWEVDKRNLLAAIKQVSTTHA